MPVALLTQNSQTFRLIFLYRFNFLRVGRAGPGGNRLSPECYLIENNLFFYRVVNRPGSDELLSSEMRRGAVQGRLDFNFR